jgi:hypothetical protein
VKVSVCVVFATRGSLLSSTCSRYESFSRADVSSVESFLLPPTAATPNNDNLLTKLAYVNPSAEPLYVEGFATWSFHDTLMSEVPSQFSQEMWRFSVSYNAAIWAGTQVPCLRSLDMCTVGILVFLPTCPPG